MERLAARGWHNAVSPPLGLREVAHAQIPGAHAPGFTISPHFGGSETNTSVNGTGMILLAVQAQLFTGPASPSRKSHSVSVSNASKASSEVSPWPVENRSNSGPSVSSRVVPTVKSVLSCRRTAPSFLIATVLVLRTIRVTSLQVM